MIGLNQEELDQFVQDYMEDWARERPPEPGDELGDKIVKLVLSHATCLIVANNKRIEEDLRKLGLINLAT